MWSELRAELRETAWVVVLALGLSIATATLGVVIALA